MILIIHAHPYPQHSRAGPVLLDAVRDLPGVSIRSLYDKYPDFDIDVEAEQAALTEARLIVWLHPIYWYSVPALL
jgi:glutathione-regulated potassium-efflux system ancillary protein KefF